MGRRFFAFLFLFLVVITLFGCGPSTLIDTDVNDIEKIKVTHNNVVIELTEGLKIEELVRLLENVSIKEKTFQEKWNEMGSSISGKTHYQITVFTKSGTFKEASSYTVYIGITYDSKSDPYFARRGDKFGTVSSSVTTYLSSLFD